MSAKRCPKCNEGIIRRSSRGGHSIQNRWLRVGTNPKRVLIGCPGCGEELELVDGQILRASRPLAFGGRGESSQAQTFSQGGR